MGLDSVELVITIEKHFAISISNAELEKAMTVQDVADLVARHRPIVPDPRDVRSEVREQLISALSSPMESVTDETPFAAVCQGHTPGAVWAGWRSTGLKLPDLPARDESGRKGRSLLWFLVPKWVAGRSVRDLSFGQVLDAIVAHNHAELIDPLRPRSRYEILMAVIGVSSYCIGVPELEIRPSDAWANDLGID